MFINLLGNYAATTANALTRRHVGVIAALVVTALAAALVLATDPTSNASVAAGPAESPHALAGPPAAAEPRLDHSVVESESAADAPDMTGASIGTYGP